jgi:hypothetical protein
VASLDDTPKRQRVCIYCSRTFVARQLAIRMADVWPSSANMDTDSPVEGVALLSSIALDILQSLAWLDQRLGAASTKRASRMPSS